MEKNITPINQLSGGLYFDPRSSIFKTKPVFTDLQFR